MRTTTGRIHSHVAEEHFASHNATFVPLKDLMIWLQDFRHLLERCQWKFPMSFAVETNLCPDPFLDFGDDDVPNHLLQPSVYTRHELLFFCLNHFLYGADLLLSFLRLSRQTTFRFVHLGGKEDQCWRSSSCSRDAPDLFRLKMARLRSSWTPLFRPNRRLGLIERVLISTQRHVQQRPGRLVRADSDVRCSHPHSERSY